MKLYELTEAYIQLQEMLENAEDDTAIKETLESIEDAIEQKVINIGKLIRNTEADVKAIKEEEKRLAEKRKALENKIQNLKRYVEDQLNMTGLDKVKTPTMSVYIQNNAPSVDIVDENVIPEQFLVIEKKPDKKAILEQLKNGIEIPGVTLKQTRSLRIR